MKWTSLPAAALAAGLALASAGPAGAVDPSRGYFNNSNNNANTGTTIPGQNQFSPTSIPGQQFFNSLGSFNDPFFTPEIYSPTTPSTIPQSPSTTPFLPFPTTPTTPQTPVQDGGRTRDPVQPLYTQPGQPPVQPQQQRWRLGVYSKDMDTGVRIHQVVANGAAARAGLEVNDTIVAVNGYQVGFVNGQLFDCATEFERHADRNGWVTMLVQNHRNNQLVNVPVQLDSRLATVQGSLAIRNGQSLPPGSIINVELREFLGGNASPVTFASTRIDKFNAHPIPFEISFDPAHLSANGQYLVYASVVQNGREVYRTAQNTPVSHQAGQPPRPINVQLDPVQPTYQNQPIQLDRNSQIAQIVKWFEQYLGRPPSDKELAVWLSAISNGYPLSQVQQELLGHNAFFNRCNQNKHTYVERVHELLVGRKPTQQEMAYWIGRYDALGGIRRDFAREFQDSLGIH